MSGIVGIVDYRHPPQQEHVRMLSAQVADRGRDAKDFFAMQAACFGYRKKQYHANQESITRIEDWILMVDSHDQVDQKIINLWKQYNIDSLPHIKGSFALAAWNIQTEQLYLARSAEGGRPLYWTQKNQKTAFCSTLPPLLSLPWVETKLASEHLAEQLSFRYVHAPRTLIDGIFSVPAGHCVEIKEGELYIRRWHRQYWSAVDTPPPPREDISSKLGSLIQQSIAQHMNTNRPVGILLSGGVDSSLLLYYACTLGPPPDTFTVRMEGVPSETSFAGRIAKLMGSKNHEIVISKNEFILAFDEASRAMGQPIPTAAAVVQYLLFTKLKGMVLLSGEGGDELFGGRSLPLLASRIARAKFVHRLPYGVQTLTQRIARRIGRSDLAARYEEYGLDRSIGSSQVFLAPQRVDILYDTGLVRPGIRKNVLTPFYQELDSDPINEILHVLQRGWLTEDALVRSDRMSHRCDVDIRHPLLSHKIIEYSSMLPGSSKIYRKGMDYIGKWPVRMLLEEKIPKDLVHRPKRTMLDPLDQWLVTEGKTFLDRQIEGICDDLPHIFVRSTVRRLHEEQKNGKKNHGNKLWMLMHFYRWWKQTFL